MRRVEAGEMWSLIDRAFPVSRAGHEVQADRFHRVGGQHGQGVTDLAEVGGDHQRRPLWGSRTRPPVLTWASTQPSPLVFAVEDGPGA
jgi:hypothetical protein